MSPLAFAQRYLGQRVSAPGGLGGQCVDLVNVWLIEGRLQQPIHANAVDWAGVPLARHTWVPNGKVNFPTGTAIVVWGPAPEVGIGIYGHIALCLAADAMHLLTLDQNWGGEVVSMELHSYRGVLGWFKPG
jgi:CHAP domain-containing protein